MIDIGANLTNSRFNTDLDEVLVRAQNHGIEHIIVTGTNVAESNAALALCEQHPMFLSCTAGVHPHDADQVNEQYLAELRHLAKQPYIKAIGECGLDFNRNFSGQAQQIAVFSAQINLAQQLNLPLFLHQRDAFDLWLELLTPYIGTVPAMIAHCFTGTKQQLADCLAANMYIGITGWICDERRGQELYEMAKYIPLNRIMVETDAPYLLPRNINPKPKSNRNEPHYLTHVIQQLAQAMGVSAQTLSQHSRANAKQVFKLGLTN